MVTAMADVGSYTGNRLNVLPGVGAWLSRTKEELRQKYQESFEFTVFYVVKVLKVLR
jgi:hypothetical protein